MIPIVAAAATRRPWTPGVSPAIPSAIPYRMSPAAAANDQPPLTAANDTLAMQAEFDHAARRDSIRSSLFIVGLLAVGVLAIIAAKVGIYLAAHSDLPFAREVLNAFN